MKMVSVSRNPDWNRTPASVEAAIRFWCGRRVLAAPSGVDYYEAADPQVSVAHIEDAITDSSDPTLGAPCRVEVVPTHLARCLAQANDTFPQARVIEVRHTRAENGVVRLRAVNA